jgi:hypothetical protein
LGVVEGKKLKNFQLLSRSYAEGIISEMKDEARLWYLAGAQDLREIVPIM